ncbi:MAG: hypothetical protein H0U98_06105 [Alphaproteobacteria bacterium]|nr:hypothetical protein [Alphaproteobacteria bacterium]
MGGAVLALLVQLSFLLLVLLTPSHPLRPVVEKETLLLLPPIAPPKPVTIDARAPSTLSTAPPVVPPPPYSPPVMIAPLAPPSGIAGFGRSLFGCAPEHYAELTPDERAHCPKPGEGMAVNQPPDLLNPPRSHAKDEALWQEQWTEGHWVPAVCPLGDGPGAVAHCLLEQSKAEHRRQQAALQKINDEKAARLQEPKRPLPKIGVRRD